MLFIFIWFAFQLFYYANNIALETFPDEPYHITVANQWKESPTFSIKDSAQTYRYGQISRQPYVYHALLGNLRKLAPSLGDDVTFYRNVGVVISLAGFIFSWLFYRQVISSIYGRIFALYFQSCLMSYPFMGAAVSYDVLTNALCFLAVWLFARSRNQFNLRDLLALITVLLAGNMVKVTFLPFTLIMGAVLFVFHFKKIFSLGFWALGANSSWKTRWLIFPLALFAFMNIEYYGVNIARHKAIVPECETILSPQICQREYEQAKRALALENEAAQKPRMPFGTYLISYFRHMEGGLLSLQAHRALLPLTDRETKGFRSILQGSILGFMMQLIIYRRKYFNKVWFALAFIAISYGAVLIAVNYSDYARYGVFGLGLQSRYWFPVLIPSVYLIVSPIFENIKKPFQVLLLIVGFIYCRNMGFHIFDLKVNATWFR